MSSSETFASNNCNTMGSPVKVLPLTLTRPPLLVLLMAGILACVGCAPSLSDLVTDESGFDGAVTVIETHMDGPYGILLARIPYLDIYGMEKEGLARLVVHRSTLRSDRAAPAFCHVHYEMGVDGAKRWAGQGWAVFSAVYNEDAPIDVSPGDGNNLARAIIQWARRLAFIDGVRLHLDGGSQGGYMSLAMSADMFPVTSATADAPVVNWAYNFGYFEANRPLVSQFENPFDSPLPVLAAVMQLADLCYAHFTNDLTDDTWHALSPVSYIARVAHPVLITFATGDMLVPMEQMTRHHLYPHDPALFPEGYARDFDSLTHNDAARITFEDALPDHDTAVHVLPLQENSYVITLDMRLGKEPHPDEKPASMDRPWSPEHQWNLCYLDEGPPAPFADHFTYAWNTTPKSFVAHYQHVAPKPDILNDAKLLRLMERYADAMENLPALSNGALVNRRNYDVVERFDVLAGLLRYAELSNDHSAHMETLYSRCALQSLGPTLNIQTLRKRLQELPISNYLRDNQ